jgi:hypothetical protein
MTGTGEDTDLAPATINKKEWKELSPIRAAVYAKKGNDFKKTFRARYVSGSVEAVKELARHFDDGWYKGDVVNYTKDVIPKLEIIIGGQKYGICAEQAEALILDVRQEVKQTRNL